MNIHFYATADGRRLKFFKFIDDHSSLCLAIRVCRRCKPKDVVAVLDELTSLYPAPAFIRSDNGAKFSAHALKRWSENSATTTAYIQPGSPWQNGFAESFNSPSRDEFLKTELFTTLAEAQALADRLRWESTSSGLRPDSSTSCCITTHSHCAWNNEVGHVMARPQSGPDNRGCRPPPP